MDTTTRQPGDNPQAAEGWSGSQESAADSGRDSGSFGTAVGSDAAGGSGFGDAIAEGQPSGQEPATATAGDSAGAVASSPQATAPSPLEEARADGDSAGAATDSSQAAAPSPIEEAQAAAARASDELQRKTDELQRAQAEAAEARDKFLRAQAEMQNLHRRTEQEREKARKFGHEALVRALLPVVDNLERALAAGEQHAGNANAGNVNAGNANANAGNEAIRAIREGVELTLKSLLDCLTRFNVAVIEPPAGEPFDHQWHNAIATQEHAEMEANTILVLHQKGYALHDRLIRPAQVVVVAKDADGQQTDSGAESGAR